MSLAVDLDAYTATLATAVGIPATRDPDLIYPPCIFVDLPPVTAATLPTMTLELPVWLVQAGAGKAASDTVLDLLGVLLDTTDSRVADPSTLTIGGQDFAGYRIAVPIVVTLTPTP